jgi:hypothetical protein
MRVWLEQWWRALTRPEEAVALFRADAGERGFVRRTALVTALAYALYGFTMGAFRGWFPAVVSGIKLPFLFLFSLLICLAPLYVLNTLFGPRLSARACLRLLVLAVSVNAVALGSYGPFSLLFTLQSSRQGYHFLVMMHVVVFALAAMASLAVVAMLFRAVAAARGVRWSAWFIAVWLLGYATVGMKMAWVLRPWIGDWEREYQPLRDLKGSFYGSVYRMVTGTEDDSETHETGEKHE